MQSQQEQTTLNQIRQNKDFFNHYKEITNIESQVKREPYYKILDLYLRYLSILLLKGNRIKLPYALGSMAFVGKKSNATIDEEGNVKGVPVDWGETKKLWLRNPVAKENKELLYHLNDHTNGYVYKLRWSYKKAKGKFKMMYIFNPSRTLKANFVKHIKENQYEYEVE